MARKGEAEELLRQGLVPSEIAARMGVSAATAIQYLRTRVGEGELRFSDIYFSWPAAKRTLLAEAAHHLKSDGRVSPSCLQELGLVLEDVQFYRSILRRRVFAGDLYEHVAEIEIALHDMVRNTLVSAFGAGEAGFWRQGVPAAIRKRCQERREEDEEPSESPFQYTTLIKLAEIMGKNWSLFQSVLPKHYSTNRHVLTRELTRLNGIRNTVMHPVKRRRWSEDDFEFAKRLRITFEQYRAT